MGVSAPTRRPRDADAEAEGQKTADAEVGDQRPVDAEVEGQRSEGQRGLKSKSGGPRPAGSGPELENK